MLSVSSSPYLSIPPSSSSSPCNSSFFRHFPLEYFPFSLFSYPLFSQSPSLSPTLSPHLSSSSSDDMDDEDSCTVIPPERSRLYLVGLGSLIAVVSVIGNVFLFIVLVRTRRHLNSPFIYLLSLSIADIFLSGAYVLLFLVNLLMDEWESTILSSSWWTYMPYVLCCSHLAITTSAFLIVAAAAERYIIISKISKEFTVQQRFIIVFFTIFISFIGKFTILFEVEIQRNGNCSGVTEWTAYPSPFSIEEPYNSVYKFWFRNIVTVMLPFILLFYLNLAIIRRLHRQHHSAKLFRFGTSTHRRNVRSATLSLIWVTCTYLASNLLNVVLNMWECRRLPIYFICNIKIRNEIIRCIQECPLYHTLCGSSNISASSSKYPLSTVRYCNSGNGLLVYEPQGTRRVGTRLDRLVLAVALGSVGRRSITDLPDRPSINKRYTIRGDR